MAGSRRNGGDRDPGRPRSNMTVSSLLPGQQRRYGHVGRRRTERGAQSLVKWPVLLVVVACMIERSVPKPGKRPRTT